IYTPTISTSVLIIIIAIVSFHNISHYNYFFHAITPPIKDRFYRKLRFTNPLYNTYFVACCFMDNPQQYLIDLLHSLITFYLSQQNLAHLLLPNKHLPLYSTQ